MTSAELYPNLAFDLVYQKYITETDHPLDFKITDLLGRAMLKQTFGVISGENIYQN